MSMLEVGSVPHGLPTLSRCHLLRLRARPLPLTLLPPPYALGSHVHACNPVPLPDSDTPLPPPQCTECLTLITQCQVPKVSLFCLVIEYRDCVCCRRAICGSLTGMKRTRSKGICGWQGGWQSLAFDGWRRRSVNAHTGARGPLCGCADKNLLSDGAREPVRAARGTSPAAAGDAGRACSRTCGRAAAQPAWA